MPSHKRRADTAESILPIRAPKQRRINNFGPLGEGSSASQTEGTLARWVSFAGQLALDIGRGVREGE